MGSVAPIRLEFCSRSDVGRVRKRNEDSLAVDKDRGWAVLADGMGGYRGGDVASRIAVEVTMRRLRQDLGASGADEPAHIAAVLEAAVREANAEIRAAAVRDPNVAGMGSTLVVGTFLADRVLTAHVGDSRMYRLRHGVLERLTRDHTMLQQLVDAGILAPEDVTHSQFRGLLTRGLGVAPVVVPESGTHSAGPGDVFLLCSDGLTDMLDDAAIAAALRPLAVQEIQPDEAADRLLALANAQGGRDNISLILVRMAA
ncbi:PP2C family protein-serine/threonine phosphatase [Aromatoleum petrolei]|uniref:SpoIIE family protein phosphatase n=1 Tax=Aromatoleum petrolei TaxID=76116 RepID=A0ABX1MJX4_9RHOO|nr:protein phosphatase 2C domain-containing protein [Aromatoleum petrolei]NMF87445.1 SpoIIE family protein phosphatase [Aromatoleum petrolei]QTQ35812.1 Putative phosphoprotein phosphatase [Aromatoleum petrolei]